MQCVWCFLMSGCCCAGVRCHSLKYQFLRVYANKRIEDLHKLLLGTLLQRLTIATTTHNYNISVAPRTCDCTNSSGVMLDKLCHLQNSKLKNRKQVQTATNDQLKNILCSNTVLNLPVRW